MTNALTGAAKQTERVFMVTESTQGGRFAAVGGGWTTVVDHAACYESAREAMDAAHSLGLTGQHVFGPVSIQVAK